MINNNRHGTCAIKFWLVPGFSLKHLGNCQNVFFFNINENKIRIIFFISAFLKSLFYLEIDIANEIRQEHKRFIKLPKARPAIKFLDLNFLGISKAFLDKEKPSVQKLYNTANQNNSVNNSYFSSFIQSYKMSWPIVLDYSK